ncbi:hypothetical protein J3Q64DRAFT_1860133 [Phycomyces blakesleeanus]|uniref:F-box domain-containing protein n=2 Tax=Phycomyces blakesleeanus TaxID=4837 RepID=A0A167MKU6_PHYB8|nr:hypothetical protein PHYBLDRAFT_168491 [Phycomyces blakesleeanus NRRL 1555(-)]OAD73139.1 hypothetical protein PHYBLDRAFT_168491 [Phycomyces blakesleeanus NRRL 1555(-)]|eukprot:XP_018291179.1 hypothetical protein PHYBLDRAFT_168491 [Phycomyces blakesleeanus NRRL 1555(-)]
MLLSELPPEILTQIAELLTATDRRSCGLVCKGWKYPFQRVLWRDTRIGSPEYISEIIEHVKYPQYLFIPCLFVHSLRLYKYYYASEISDVKFSEIFRYMPNLKRLEISIMPSIMPNTKITRTEKIWTSLESLKIQYGSKCEQKSENLLNLVNACNMLQELEIIRKGRPFGVIFSMDDFDSMHQNLQSLSSISIEMYLNSEFSAKLDTIPNTTPAFAKELIPVDEFGNDYKTIWDPLWLYYFGYKYPNLRSLKLYATDIRRNATNWDERQAIISRFQFNPKAFRCLETFSFTTDSYFSFSDFVLWELFYALRVPLKHLVLDATKSEEVDDSHPIDVNRILQSFSKTLKSLSVTGFIYNARDQDPTFRLSSYYPLLTSLCISGSNVFLNLDNLLDKFATLKQLKFRGEKLVITPITTTEKSKQKQQKHRLEILTLERCAADVKVFNYISFRCRSLRHMTLNTLHATGSISEKTGCLLLDMPHTFLKTLNIGQVRYSTSYEELGTKDDICLTLLSQLNNAPLSDEKNETEQNKMDSVYPISAIHNIDWLYTYDSNEGQGIDSLETKKLSKEETNIALEYYKNFQSNKINQISEEDNSYNGEDPKAGWEYELYKGYGELRLGKIEVGSFICAPDGYIFKK